MPRCHGGMNNNLEHIDRRRNLLKRSLDKKNCQFGLKDPQVSALVLRNTEQRCIVFTLVSLKLDAYWKLVQGPELGNYLQPRVSGVNCESISPPLIVFRVNLPEEQRNSVPVQSSSACSSSGTHVMHIACNRHKRSKSLDDSSIASLPKCSEVDSFGSLCDSLGTVGSDVMVNDTPIVEKSQKKRSRKKGKKGKKYKRSIRKNISTELEGQHEEITCGASVVEDSTYSALASLDEHVSGSNLSENAIPSLSAEDIIIEEDGSESNNDYVDSSTTMMSCISYSDELDDFETTASTSLGFVSGSTCDLNSKSSAKCCPERTPCFVDVVSANCQPQRSRNNIDNSFSITLDKCDDDSSPESFHDCWNDDISENCSNDVETRAAIQDKCELDISRMVDSELMNCVPSFYGTTVDSFVMGHGITNDCQACDPYEPENLDTTEKAECSSQACNNNDFQPVISGKRGRTTRKMASRMGKKNNHPVWKKVQKLDTEHCINAKKEVSAISHQMDFSSKTRSRLDSSDFVKQNKKGKNVKLPHSYEVNNQTSTSYSGKIATVVDSRETNGKRKPSSALKLLNRSARNGSSNGNVTLSKPSESLVQKNDRLRNLPELNEVNLKRSNQLNSQCSNDSLVLVEQTEKVDICWSDQQKINRHYLYEGSLSENTYRTSVEMTSASTDSQIGPPLAAIQSLDHTSMEVHSNVKEHTSVPHLFPMDSTNGKCSNMQAKYSHTEYSEPDIKWGPMLQKWVPVGRKETVISCTSMSDNMKASIIDESVLSKVDIKSAEEEPATQVHSFVPSTRGELQCSNCSTAERCCLPLENDESTVNVLNDCCTDGDFLSVLDSSLHLNNEVQYQEFPQSESGLDKIIHAVNNSYNLYNMAEAVRQVTGTPVAEFERFFHSTSPIICKRCYTGSCRSCFPEQLRNDSRSVHWIHNITLADLWQWYEEPGCYGLEVKAEENCSSKRLHNGQLEFKAYFVPYLSVVQLFGRTGINNASCNGERQLPSESYKTSKSPSDLRPFTVSAELRPQPCKEKDACLLGSSSVKDKLLNRSVRIANLSDGELIFEYFEHAQPPQRRPLFEKIKELVNCDTPSDHQIYGDPLKLECMNLGELHPASWYAVAWYPIYRIPEGNFRAAFLTYHSLGHFIHQSVPPNMACGFTHIVCPVVGLQSYSAKKEGWLQPRVLESKETHTEISYSDTSKLVEERLRSLEHTASVMSTATVRKGNHRLANNHPDFNHFLSRW